MTLDRFVLLMGLLLLTGTTAQAASFNAPGNDTLQGALTRAAPDANPKVIELAVRAAQCRMAQGYDTTKRLAIIDYSLPSTAQRLWIFDLQQRTLLFHELVAHGRNSGENMAKQFSNRNQSMASSLGLYSTRSTYIGHNGYSLRMEGLEPGFNDNALDRALVIHGAPYVDQNLARTQGRIGRSLGCPAVRPAIAHQVIDALKEGQLLFSYYPEPSWLGKSAFVNCARDTVASTAGSNTSRN
ncbi:MAG TPA: murein L,D-transpeptidase catalytic domain family protein [Pseudomonas sp.]|uniref:murein L,D-transpeptidase catalytic domain family protein n=1 Tax=Pseudomonas sp. TaxID=306 RepID=UPI002EDA0835